MESNTRSPIFSGFGELLEGVVRVRALSAEQKFLDGFHQKIDQTTKVHVSLYLNVGTLLCSASEAYPSCMDAHTTYGHILRKTR